MAQLTGSRNPPRWLPWLDDEQQELRVINYAINTTILGVVSAAAVAQIVTVDSDLWRGWHLYEIVRRIPTSNWDMYQAALAEHPVLTKVGGTVEK